MTWLAVWLVGVGLADLVRASDRPHGERDARVVGAVAVVVIAGLAGRYAPVDAVVLLGSLVALVLWLRYSQQALTTGSGHVAALAWLASGAVWLLLLSGLSGPVAGPVARWLACADLPPAVTGAGPGQALLVLGLLLVNLSTANVVVRLVLIAIHALPPARVPDDPTPRASDQLRGGRLLGPMERLLILGLGLAGQLGAAGLVIAAKGLIRFPELQSKRGGSTVEGVGIDAVTEYFLVGSFISWLVALGSLVLAS